MHISTGACRGQKRILDYLKLGVIGHCVLPNVGAGTSLLRNWYSTNELHYQAQEIFIIY